MGKVRKNNRDEIEYLKGLIRNQKAEIVQLKREIKSLSETKQKKTESFKVQLEELKLEKCTNCEEGTLEDKELPFGILKVCKLCKKMKVVRNKNVN